jgi:hypothetical protein
MRKGVEEGYDMCTAGMSRREGLDSGKELDFISCGLGVAASRLDNLECRVTILPGDGGEKLKNRIQRKGWSTHCESFTSHTVEKWPHLNDVRMA